MSVQELLIEGAKQNNLKNISLRIPHNRVIAVTGVSGSGKSSLAFDTIFAEGQWRFIESLSTYARLFLEKLDRPDVDAIYNIRPAVALEQKNPVRGSRSTVGTLTELYDLLRLLFAKVSTPYCPSCGSEIRTWDPSQIVRTLVDEHTGKKALILFDTTMPLQELQKQGYHRLLVNNAVIDISDLKDPVTAPPFTVVLDRLLLKDDPRLSDSVEMAWREGNGRAAVMILDSTPAEHKILQYTSAHACDACSTELPEPAPILFSFNHPVGACARCKGFGNILEYDEGQIIPDRLLSLSEGAIEPWEKPAYRWWKRQLITGAKKSGIDVKKPYQDLSPEMKRLILEGNEHFYGLNDFFEELESKRYKLHVRVFLSRYRRAAPCPECLGKRLKKEALSYRIADRDIAGFSDMPISKLSSLFRDIDLSPFQKDTAKEILRQIGMKLAFLQRVGLDYLSLSRLGKTLSGGEYQRINLSNQLASALTGTLYVLDEPTVGLHPRDTDRIAKIMNELSEMGNTIIVVEHDKGIIRSSDWVVELGPGGGQFGGEVVFSGPQEEFVASGTLTARCLAQDDRAALPQGNLTDLSRRTGQKQHRTAPPALILSGAQGNNLRNIDLRVPLSTLTAVTGVSGSGKSSLVVETLYRALVKESGIQDEPPLPYRSIIGNERIMGVKVIDQSPIGRSPRSNPITYLKIFDQVRKLLSALPESRAHGYGPGFFSFNVPGGRCETCSGEGYQKMEMYFFEDIYVTCEECGGKRYKPEALMILYRGKNIDDILGMTVDEAARLFHDIPAIMSRLRLLQDIGMGYIRLGQPATTLSGGEAQRLKICSELSSGRRENVLYILDEPTVGLHPQDTVLLLTVLRKLVDAGNTVIVIEHNLDVIAAADWIIDLGPEGGDKGGKIIFEGTPREIVKCRESYTGQYLRSVRE